MKILVFDAKKYDKKSFAKANKNNHDFVFRSGRLTSETVHYAEEFEAVCTFVNCDGSAQILNKLADYGVKYIFQRAAGYNNIDLKRAKELGIKVYRVPAYSPEAVAEHAMTLLTAINRNIHIAYNRTKTKNFALDGLEGETIYGNTIGVIGAGRIGQAFIKIAKGFGAKVIVFDEYAQKHFAETADKLGFEYVDKATLFKESDFISLHAPLLESTKYIVNKKTLAIMKKHAIIVNTARGLLINTEELLDALDHGRIRGAGLDVYENETGVFFFDHSNNLVPDPFLSRLRAHRNVILTSHQAFFTNLALKQIAETTAQNIELALNDELGTCGLDLQADGKVING